MTWQDRLRDEVPLDRRGRFLADLQNMVASLRNDRPPHTTDLLFDHAELALAYMDAGPKKEKARQALAHREQADQ